jgi:Rod binding domain-containing protein
MVGYMLKSMRSSVPKGEMSGDSYGGDMMEGMFDSEFAGYVSRGSHLGLGEMLYKEITGEELPRTKAPVVAGPKLQAPTIRSTAATEIIRTTPAPVQKTVVPVGEDPVRSASVRHEDKDDKTERSIVGPGTMSAPPDTVQRRLEALTPIIRDAADTTGVNPSLLKAVIATESAARAGARSSKNAKGLMQLIDSTAAAMGVQDVWDPRQNVQGGARYLGQMMHRFGGNIEHAVASYNAGPGAVEKHNGVPPYKETQAYVGKVLEYLRYFEQQETGDNDQE